MQHASSDPSAGPVWSGDLARADAIHRYPAKMALGLALSFFDHTVRKHFGQRKDLRIHDPFCGSGTTLLVARSRGLTASGCDLLQSSVFLARAKVNRLGPHGKATLAAALKSDPLSYADEPNLINWETWATWYHPQTLRAIQDLRDYIWSVRRSPAFPHLFTALSQTCWDVSSADPDVMVPTHSSRARGIRLVAPLRVLLQFRKRLLRIDAAQAALARLGLPASPAPVSQGSALVPAAWPAADVVFTSPPYGLGLDYARANSLQTNALLGGTTKIERRDLIGRRGNLNSALIGIPEPFVRQRWVRDSFNADPSRLVAFAQYVDDMREVLLNARRKLEDNGMLAVVVGDPEMAGRRVPLADVTRCLAVEAGFSELYPPRTDPIRRRFQATRRRSSAAPIQTETLLTFELN